MNAEPKEMTACDADENCPASVSASGCTHANMKKVAKFGRKCAVCKRRVWKFWKTRKCQDCKIILHRSCVTAWEIHTFRENIGRYVLPPMTPAMETTTAAAEVKAPAVEATWAMARCRAGADAPLYVNPRPWTWANITTVTVDCRRRPEPLTVTVSHGHALTAAMFAWLLEKLSPTDGRPSRSSAPMSTRQVNPTNAVKPVAAAAVERGHGDHVGRV